MTALLQVCKERVSLKEENGTEKQSLQDSVTEGTQRVVWYHPSYTLSLRKRLTFTLTGSPQMIGGQTTKGRHGKRSFLTYHNFIPLETGSGREKSHTLHVSFGNMEYFAISPCPAAGVPPPHEPSCQNKRSYLSRGAHLFQFPIFDLF